MLAQEIIIGYLLDEKKLDGTIDVMYAYDDKLEYAKVTSYIDDLYADNKKDLSDDQKRVVADYIKKLRNSGEEVENLLLEMAAEIVKKNGMNPAILNMDTTTFWTTYSIAVKKCLFNPTVQLDSGVYYSGLKDNDTKGQIIAHRICLTAFNLDADSFRKTEGSLLCLLLPNIRRPKRIRTKKKYVNMVAKEAKKLTIHYKAIDPSGSVFKEKSPKVIEAFKKKIIHEYIS